ncbi:hypothetical protein [Amycolatopsis minnesotensis]|uniref:Uncharacterized protein n=1 Tax=Amycolatopsis minnesotensis TaxID=337894 RepID=A0ABN2SAR4_9PSEU
MITSDPRHSGEITDLPAAIDFFTRAAAYCARVRSSLSEADAQVRQHTEDIPGIAMLVETARTVLAGLGFTGGAVARILDSAHERLTSLSASARQLDQVLRTATEAVASLEDGMLVMAALFHGQTGAAEQLAAQPERAQLTAFYREPAAAAPEPAQRPHTDHTDYDGAPGAVAAARALRQAYHDGFTPWRALHGGIHATSVTLGRLADGTAAVLKRVNPDEAEDPDEVENDYLGGLVATALGIDRVAVARLDENTTLARFLDGDTGTQRCARAENIGGAAGELAELERLTRLRHGREIGLLDFLSNNLDRNDGNFLVDGGTVRPIDHGSCIFGTMRGHDPEDGEEMYSPFARAHLHRHGDVIPDNTIAPAVPSADLHCPFTGAELARHRANLARLEPEFAACGALAKHEFVMRQLDTIATANRRTHAPVSS